MLTLEELQRLVAAICDPTSSREVRGAAERRLNELQSEPGAWSTHVALLPVVDDQNLFFFICLGLERILWKIWPSLSVEDQQVIAAAIVGVLREKSLLLNSFARNKAEQVLGVICQSSYSLEPVLSLVTAATDPNALTGISSLKTCLEEILGRNPRISPERKVVMVRAAAEIASPATTLACNILNLSVQASTGDTDILVTSIQLLKLILGKMQIGPHVTPDVLHILFAVAELGAAEGAAGQAYAQSSITALEALTEFMSQRYIPRDTATGVDVGGALLVELVAKSVGLLQRYRYVYTFSNVMRIGNLFSAKYVSCCRWCIKVFCYRE